MFKLFAPPRSPRHQLFSAARNGDLKRLVTILNTGLAVDTLDRNGRSVLFLASKYGHEAIVKELLDRGANVNIADGYGQTPLFNAIYAGSGPIVQMLVAAGSDLQVVDSLGCSLSEYAKLHFRATLLPMLAGSPIDNGNPGI